MSFRSPWMLVALVVIPAVVAAYVSSRRQRSRRAATLAAQGLVTTPFSGRGGWRRHVPFALFVAALVVLVVSLARPSMTIRTPRREATVVLAIDVSSSMGADDVKPTRFEAEKTAAKAFVDHQPSSVLIGVVAFGQGAVNVQEPTSVHANVDAAIDRLSLGGGTALGQGLISSLSVIAGKPVAIDPNQLQSDAGQVDIGYFGSSTIVLFSDGENLADPDPVSVADVASVAGVHVQSVGVGTEAGAVVQIDGFSVATALDTDLLTAVAKAGDGTYHQAADATGLAAISKTIDLHFKTVSKHTEVTGLFSAIGAVLLAAGALLSILWFGRVV
jgi:Ca-activated chloride channel family protein